MKYLLKAILVLALLSQIVLAAEVETLSFAQDKDIYSDGDMVTIRLNNWESGETIRNVQMIKQNHRWAENINPEVLTVDNYYMSRDGEIEVTLDQLDKNDNWVTFVVYTDKRVYHYGIQTIHVKSAQMEELNIKGALAQFSITDVSGGTFDVSDSLDVSGDGFDSGETILAEIFYELNGSLEIVDNSTPTSSSVAIGGGAADSIAGRASRDGSGFNANTVYIQYYVLASLTSSGVYSSINLAASESDAPNFFSARTLTQTTIEVTFDEMVTTPSTNGNAIDNWNVADNTVTSMTPLGSTGTTVCTLTVSTPLDRGDTPTVTFTGTDTEYEDAAGNFAEDDETGDQQARTPTDGIVPGNLVLFIGTNSNILTVADFIGSSAINLYAHVDDGWPDTSIDGVIFQGSDNGSSWTAIGTDGSKTQVASSDSAEFFVSWTPTGAAQYKMIRAIAFDGSDDTYNGNENETVAAAIGSDEDGLNQNFEDSYRVEITDISPTTIDAGTGASRAAVTFQVQNNYGSPVNTLDYNSFYGFNDDGSSTDTWWDDASGSTELPPNGPYFADTLTPGTAQGIVYYSNSSTGDYTISVQQVSAGEELTDDTDTYDTDVTVQAGSFDHFNVALAVSGDKSVDSSFDIEITAVDAGDNTITGYSGTVLDIYSNATASPGSDVAEIGNDTDGGTADGGVFRWDVSGVTFTNGVATVSCTFTNVQTVWISAEEDGDSYSSSQDNGTGDFNMTVGALADFIFSGSGSELEGIPFDTGYDVSAVDQYENVLTAYSSDVTLSVVSGTGTVDVSGLSGDDEDVIAGDSFSSGVAVLDNVVLTRTDDDDPSGDYDINAYDGSSINSATDLTVTLTRRTATVSNYSPAENAHVNAQSSPSAVTLSCDIDLDENTSLSDDYRIYYNFSNTIDDMETPTSSPDLTYVSGGVSFSISQAILESNSGFTYLNWYVYNASSVDGETDLSGGGSGNVQHQVINPGVTIRPQGGNGGDISGGGFQPLALNDAIAFSLETDETDVTINWNRVRVTLDGTYLASDIDNLSIFRDNGSVANSWDAGDTYLGTVSVTANGVQSLNIPLNDSEGITNTTTTFLIGVITTATADETRTLRVFIQNDVSNFRFDNDYVNGGDQEFYGRTFIPDANIGLSTDVSLPVELASFTAQDGYGKIELTWETASEIDNEGFHVLRSTEREGGYSQITNTLIPGNGNSNVAHSYSYIDEDIEEETTYFYQIVSYDVDGTANYYPLVAEAYSNKIPRVFSLEQNYPNPFNPSTYFHFSIPRDGRVSLVVYNALGQEVKRILNSEQLSVGEYRGIYSWDGTNQYGQTVSSGIYFFRLISLDYNYSKTMKMMFLK